MNPAAVVVGVDAAGSSADAVDWAAAEAATRGRPLHLVHVVRPPLTVDPYVVVLTTMEGMAVAWTEGERILAEAVARIRSIAPDTEVSTRLAHGGVVRGLSGEAGAAGLLVVGRRTRKRMRDVLSTAVCAQLVRDAPCPVVVIPPRSADGDPARSMPRVVVGIDAGTSCAAAVGFAFDAARQRGIPLIAVHAQAPGRLPGSSPEVVAATQTWRTFERALGCWQGRFPDVAVHVALVRADPASALLAQSHGAALLVIGGAGGHARRSAIGLVSRTVLSQGTCPLVIVRQDAASPAPGQTRELHRRRGRRAPKT